jgi:transcriptional regulator with AAA-type ATPase domain
LVKEQVAMGFVTEGPTTTTPDTSYDPGAGRSSERPQLYLVLECDRPLARGVRYGLWDVDEVVVGRGSARDARREAEGGVRRLLLRIPGGFVSSLHARFVRLGDDWLLEDAHSTNGCFVNGERVTRRQLKPGDVIEIGHKLFMLSVEPTPVGMALDLDGANLDGQPGMRTLIPRLAEQFAALRRIAPTGLSIILLGETGTGKELLADAVHQLSGRVGPLIAVNCGALTANLAESQLFGHGRGAFSGAIRDEPGFVRSADGGSLLLDEIGDLPEAMQPILLRVLQDMRVVPVGSAQARAIDVRFMAATHQDIPSLAGNGRFRRDLLARLNGFTLSLPPLRERKQDLGLLIGELLSRHHAAPRMTIAPDAGRALLAYDWPANIRELEQCLRRGAALGNESVIRLADLPAELCDEAAPSDHDGAGGGERAAWSDADVELRNALLERLREHGGNVSEVARTFGKARVQIQRWMKRFGLQAEQFRT